MTKATSPARLAPVLLLVASSVFAGAIEDSAQLLQQGNSVEALARIDRYLAAQPADVRARLLKGVILAEQQKHEEAIAVYRALIDDAPELPEPYNNLAVLYAARGDYEEAKAALERAIENRPDYAIAHENLGDVLAALAARQYERALQLNAANSALKDKLEALRRPQPTPSR